MRTKVLSGILCCFLTLIISFSLVPLRAECYEYTVDEVQDLIDGIVAYKLNESGAGSVQDWINGSLTSGAGSVSEWYVIALSQNGYSDFSSYESALNNYLENNNVASATSREKYAIALSASGSGSRYISDILDDTIGQQGIMSWIYGLHILNNDYTCNNFNTDSVIYTLLSMQYDDGGWALFGGNGDIDVTAMTIQSLAPHYPYNSDVQYAVDRGLDFLSQSQQENGGYESFGTPNPESTSQVLTALSALGIDCQYDDRFIKNGNTLIDGISRFQLPDGSFSHTEGGASNETATVQAYYSLIAYQRLTRGQGPFFVLDNRQPQDSPQQITQQLTTAQKSVSNITTTTSIRKNNTDSGSNGGKTDNTNNSSAIVRTTMTSVTAKVSGQKVTSVTTAMISEINAGSSIKGTAPVSGSDKDTKAEFSSESSSTTTKISKGTSIDKKIKNYKPTAILIIIGSGLVLSIIIFVIGKRSYKNFIFVGIVVIAGIAIVLLTDIRSPDEYYNGEIRHKENAIGTVTMEIRCDTVVGKSDSEYIPDDGTILDVTEFEIQDGDTVFDILTEAAQTYGIQIENTGSAGNAHGMIYIAGINYLYEFDFGDLSGWVYHVNGISPSRNCGEYVLSDGDVIEWLYTCELGYDLNEVYEE